MTREEATLRTALQAIMDLPTVVPDHPHGGVHPPYLEWTKVAAIARAALASDADVVCVCTHARSDHYIYSLNGHGQMRCRACDPHTGQRMPGGNYAMTSGSYEAEMYLAADHDFVPANAPLSGMSA